MPVSLSRAACLSTDAVKCSVALKMGGLYLKVIARKKHRAPPRKHITPAQKKRFEEIQSRRNREAEGLEIDPTIIVSRATMVRLACEADGVLDEMLPWHRELLGMD